MWNEIRDQFRERLPAIVDFAIYIVFVAMVATVLLGLCWLYIEHGPIAGLIAVAIITICGILNERRRPSYTDAGGWPGPFGGGRPSLPPLAKNALAKPGAPQIGRTQNRPLPGPKGK
jgi:hypothetical protein